MRIGPGSPCRECHEVYGQHKDGCKVLAEKKKELKRQQEMAPERLLERIKKLEKRVAELEE